MAGNDNISGKHLAARPSDEAIYRSITSLSRTTQIRLVREIFRKLPMERIADIMEQYPQALAIIERRKTDGIQ